MRAHHEYDYLNIRYLYLHRADPVKAAISFDTSYRRPFPLTMATPTGPPSLVLPTTSYWYYFSRAETDTFRGRYTTPLAPYSTNPANDVDDDDNAAPSDDKTYGAIGESVDVKHVVTN